MYVTERARTPIFLLENVLPAGAAGSQSLVAFLEYCMDPALFDRVSSQVAEGGAEAAFAAAEAALVKDKDFHRLFDLLLMKARHDLGLQLYLRAPASALPKETQDAYEPKVVEAARRVGGEFLNANDLVSAFPYFNMIGELEPMRAAINSFAPGENANDVDSIVDIAIANNVHPTRGLEIVVDRFGICQGITTCEQLLSQGLRPPERDECIKLLVRKLHEELTIRLRDDIEAKEGRSPSGIPAMLKDRDWLFADEAYHVDTSHLNAVVRMARMLPKCEELFLAIQLCDYGRRLSPRYRYPEPAPFEDVFASSAAYLKVIGGLEVQKGLEYFKNRADVASPEEVENNSPEVYVHLLTMLGRKPEAVAYAGRKLNRVDRRPAFGLTVNDLCQEAGDFDSMARFAKARGDLLGFVAGIVQGASKEPAKA
jgi:hypothetical protein